MMTLKERLSLITKTYKTPDIIVSREFLIKLSKEMGRLKSIERKYNKLEAGYNSGIGEK